MPVNLFKASFSVLLLAALFSFNSQAAFDEDEDFWLLLDYDSMIASYPQSSLWIYGGADDSDGSYYGLSADIAIVEALHINFSDTEQNYTVNTTDLRWGFSGLINDSVSWAITRKFWGKEKALEKRDTAFSLGYLYKQFNIRTAYENGGVELFLKNLPLIKRNSISTGHHAYELSMGYSWPVFYTQVGYIQHDYDWDISQLFNYPRLLSAINSIGVQQATALAKNESSVLFGVQATGSTYELIISHIKSAITREYDTFATLHFSTSLTQQFALGLNAELPVNDVPFSAGLSLGFMW